MASASADTPLPVVQPIPGFRDRIRSVREAIERYGSVTRQELEPACRKAGVAWPPKRVQLVAFKADRLVEVWGANAAGPYHRMVTYPILAASGSLGPKRREGDLQVPEGFYRLTTLNPLSRFHLSLCIDYPNSDDVRNATVPRSQMGSDIYMHGNAVSIGCIAIGDGAIERVFTLAAQVPAAGRRILIAPTDFRTHPDYDAPADQPDVRALYRRLKVRLKEFPTTG